MIPNSLNLRHCKGGDFLDSITVTGEDLDSATILMKIKTRNADTTEIMELSTDNGRITGVGDQVMFNVPRADWASVDPDLYVYTMMISFTGSAARDTIVYEGIFDLGESAV